MLSAVKVAAALRSTVTAMPDCAAISVQARDDGPLQPAMSTDKEAMTIGRTRICRV
jgi:hypothetical protein